MFQDRGIREVNLESKQLIERYMAAYFEVTKRLNGQIRDIIQEDITMEQFQILKYIAPVAGAPQRNWLIRLPSEKVPSPR